MIHYGSCSVLVIHAEVVIEFENRLEFVIWSCVRWATGNVTNRVGSTWQGRCWFTLVMPTVPLTCKASPRVAHLCRVGGIVSLWLDVKGFTPLCLTWAALIDGGLVTASPWIPPEVWINGMREWDRMSWNELGSDWRTPSWRLGVRTSRLLIHSAKGHIGLCYRTNR